MTIAFVARYRWPGDGPERAALAPGYPWPTPLALAIVKHRHGRGRREQFPDCPQMDQRRA